MKSSTFTRIELQLILVAIVVAVALLAGVHIPPEAAILGAALTTQMTPAGARVVDPILTTAAQGYKNADLVCEVLFPVVPVDQRGGKIITFRKEDFELYATGRVPGQNTRRVQFGYDGAAFALEQHALEGTVPFEIMQDANAVPGINMGKVAVMKTQNIIALRCEKACADLARAAANYPASNKVTLAGVDQWSDYANSDPFDDVETAIEAVRAKIGRRPNAAVLGAKVMSKLKYHPKALDRIKYTGRDSVTAEMLAALFGLKKLAVGDAVYLDNAGAMNDVWGKDMVLGYTEIGTLQDMGLPSYGYTYRLRGFPIVETPYQDRNAKSWVYPATDELSPVIASNIAGYLIQSAVA